MPVCFTRRFVFSRSLFPRSRFDRRDTLRLVVAIAILTAVVLATAAGVSSARFSSGAGAVGHLGHVPTPGLNYGGNWAGYATTGPATTAEATFVVPTLRSCGATENSWDAWWAGIDGHVAQVVEQDGIYANCLDGQVMYEAWWWMYPSDHAVYPVSGLNSVAIHAGDTVDAKVTFVGSNRYQMQVTDRSDGQGFDVTESGPAGASNLGAECVAEDPGSPSSSGGYTAYADYGVVDFTQCLANGQPIGEVGGESLVDVGGNGAQEGPAYPSGLTNSSSFTVTQGARPGTDTLSGPATGMAAAPDGSGYWEVDGAGDVAAFGSAGYYGSMSGAHLNAPISHIVSTADGKGYWLVASDGGVFSFGDAPFFGSMGGSHLNAPVVDIAPTPSGHGYWLVASDGGIFAFGDAGFYGSMGGSHLNKPVVGMAGDPTTGGYWLVASDGGIFAFHAPFFGSTGASRLNSPIIGMEPTANGGGYRFVASDGGVFSFGDAPFYGSLGGEPSAAPTVGMAADNASNGYWLVETNGVVSNYFAPRYGDAS